MSNSPNSPLLTPRQQTVVQMARERGYVTVEELVEKLDVTHQTVRRDLTFLCDHGVLARFHGGATFRTSVANVPYEARRDSLIEEKAKIGHAVAAEIPDRSSVFIDIGTTAEAVAMSLREKSGLRIVTNNINVINLLATKADFEIVVCGGTIRNRDLAVVGEAARNFVEQFRVDFAILGVVGIAEDGSILDFSIDEKPLTQAIIRCGRKVFVVADHTKFGRYAVAKVAHLSEVNVVCSDQNPEPKWRKLLDELKIELILPAPNAS